MLRSRFSTPPPTSPLENPPEIKSKKPSSSIFSKKWFRFLATLLFIVYVLIPLAYVYFPSVRRQSVFLNYVSLSRVGNLSQPTSYGLECVNNLYLPSEPNIKLGTWHVHPKDNCKGDSDYFDPRLPVVVYVHGNAGTRGGGHRVELYKLLSSEKLGLPVVAFDYRGYGDSSNVPPTAKGLVKDTKSVYDWVHRHGGSKILVWGHSLGTAVAVSMVAELCQEGRCPLGLVLEAPFTKVTDAAKYYPLAIIHRYMPFFETIFVKSLDTEETQLDSEVAIRHVKCPILIIHAQDDAMVPIQLGRQLYKTAQKYTSKVSMVEFPHFGHKGLYKDSSLPDVFRDFLKTLH